MAAAIGEEEDPTPPAKRRRSDDDSDIDASEKASEHGKNSDSSGQNPPYIDESLYSRQLYVLGRDAMVRMAQSDVLISGLGGLGVEVAKNIVLAGVRSVTLHDEMVCTRVDLSSQYYLNKDTLGQNRAEACEAPLARLNKYVRVTTYTKPLTEEFLMRFNVVVLTETPLEDQEYISDVTRDNNIALIVADTRGLAGQIFCDFGDNFHVTDTNGEQPMSVSIGSITKAKEGVVSCLDQMRHGFEDNDYVSFSEVKGMTEINNCPPMKVKVLSPTMFTVGDTTQLGDYTSGGVATLVKMPKDVQFKSFKESMRNPDFVVSDFAKMNRPAHLHLGFQALHAFEKLHSRLPWPWNKDDAAMVVQLAMGKNEGLATPLEKVDQELITTLSYVSSGSLCPMQAVIGSVAAQEVIKACSGKFSPIQQWFYFDAFECLPHESDVSEPDANAMERSRYAGQARVFGANVQRLLMTQTYFVVGAGAVGCELLKNFAMMGIGVDSGCIYVTDMDVIERSNLNGHFLLRSQDVGAMKSIMAAQTLVEMNPEINIHVRVDRVGPDTEHIYNDDFFEYLDGVAIAVDNVDARRYMDERCVLYGKPLIESATTGTKGSVQVVVPHMTESASSSRNPPEKPTPICTINNFPNNIEHILQWARLEFDGLFKQSAANAVQYLTDPDFLPRTLKTLQFTQKVALLEGIKKILVDEQATNFEDCVAFARHRFQDQYSGRIRQLLRVYPEDHIAASGAPFWSGHKHCPRPIEFDADETLHMDYIVAAANLRAKMFGIPHCTDREEIADILEEVDVPALDPQQEDVQVAGNEAKPPQPAVPQNYDEELLAKLMEELPSPEDLDYVSVKALEFETDDDSNFHVDFIVAASKLRAANYSIEPADRLKSKLIAGKITPAIATTASLVAGLASLELYKLAQRHDDLKLYKNGFVNLALSLFCFAEPVAPIKKKFNDQEFTLWDCVEVQGETTLSQFLEHVENEHKVKIVAVTEGERVLYASFLPSSKNLLELSMSEVVEEVTKRKIHPDKRALVFDLICEDTNGRGIEFPRVRYMLPS